LSVKPWEIDDVPRKYFYPGWSSSSVQWMEFEEKESQQCTFHTTTLISKFTKRELSMQFLLHINEDFDDDLLQDSIELIV
jgi:hypothetical protein